MSERTWIAVADRRVGLLGGTFDPIHYGHLAIADEVAEALRLDRVYFIPAARPPHKLDLQISSAVDRAAMVDAAIADNPRFRFCSIELEREGPSYTVDTLEALANEADSSGIAREFFFILSSEAAAALPTWHAPARILELARLAVVPRPDSPMPDGGLLTAQLNAAGDRVLTIDTLPLTHSASRIRRRVAAGMSIRYLVPPAVETHIADHRLYISTKPTEDAK